MAWIAEQALKVHMHVDKVFDIKEGGDIEVFITLVPKVYNKVFLFVGLTTFGTFIEF